MQTTSAGVGRLVHRLGIQPGDVLVTTASGVHARPLAEFVFMTLLMAVKDYAELEKELREAQSDAEENERLRNLLGLKEKRRELKFEAATVTAVEKPVLPKPAHAWP